MYLSRIVYQLSRRRGDFTRVSRCLPRCVSGLARGGRRTGRLPCWERIYLELQAIDPAHDYTFPGRYVDLRNRIPEFPMNEDFALRS
jgi:hypothetical protein